MRVASSLAIEPHLDDEETEHRTHHDNARHGGILVSEEIGETRVHQVAKGSWKQL